MNTRLPNIPHGNEEQPQFWNPQIFNSPTFGPSYDTQIQVERGYKSFKNGEGRFWIVKFRSGS